MHTAKSGWNVNIFLRDPAALQELPQVSGIFVTRLTRNKRRSLSLRRGCELDERATQRTALTLEQSTNPAWATRVSARPIEDSRIEEKQKAPPKGMAFV